jgi:hypothetical protein
VTQPGHDHLLRHAASRNNDGRSAADHRPNGDAFRGGRSAPPAASAPPGSGIEWH